MVEVEFFLQLLAQLQYHYGPWNGLASAIVWLKCTLAVQIWKSVHHVHRLFGGAGFGFSLKTFLYRCNVCHSVSPGGRIRICVGPACSNLRSSLVPFLAMSIASRARRNAL